MSREVGHVPGGTVGNGNKQTLQANFPHETDKLLRWKKHTHLFQCIFGSMHQLNFFGNIFLLHCSDNCDYNFGKQHYLNIWTLYDCIIVVSSFHYNVLHSPPEQVGFDEQVRLSCERFAHCKNSVRKNHQKPLIQKATNDMQHEHTKCTHFFAVKPRNLPFLIWISSGGGHLRVAGKVLHRTTFCNYGVGNSSDWFFEYYLPKVFSENTVNNLGEENVFMWCDGERGNLAWEV